MVNLGFKYPMTVSSMGMLASGLLSFLCCRVFKLVEAKNKVALSFFVSRVSSMLAHIRGSILGSEGSVFLLFGV